ncbi:xanthine dehydrogenase accessory protein XdhC [Tropicimonas isoalkanivorans]|uniref:Molybdenum cofactor sulfurylase n=1 Tax=Tropicimonas isoalkanivorans TaxID=441112 RepID=A0A1I1NH05_9RHOB|nr:xanthine dehydrogenase accessory protein XdhC [Tropicimonas isoalkanivorans]SFC96919.1 molybdenum cofactor sulfurylase [Tropicimonas isoalkanivorans]
MSFDAHDLRQAISAHGRVARVVVAEVKGSTPREAGASMLIWRSGQSGTIGGGALELEATRAARAALASGGGQLVRHALGPALGQCCGGAVTLATEVWDAPALDRVIQAARHGWVIRPVGDAPAAASIRLRQFLRDIRNGSAPPSPGLYDGWLAEPMTTPRHALWLYGAGHVGRAIAGIVAPLPDWHLTWVDTHADRFPDVPPDGASLMVATDPARAVAHAPADAHHLILTYSHALDLALCHAVLDRGFASAGVIGSATKWRRFQSRLRQLGHRDAEISRIVCPIGDARLGKHPQAIAIGTIALLLQSASTASETAMDRPA